MCQINIRRRQQQRSRSHAFQSHRAGFVMSDFRPLFDHIAFVSRRESLA